MSRLSHPPRDRYQNLTFAWRFRHSGRVGRGESCGRRPVGATSAPYRVTEERRGVRPCSTRVVRLLEHCAFSSVRWAAHGAAVRPGRRCRGQPSSTRPSTSRGRRHLRGPRLRHHRRRPARQAGHRRRRARHRQPAVDAPLRDGDNVIVRYGRKLTITVDGKTPTTGRPRPRSTPRCSRSASAPRAPGCRCRGPQPIGRQGLALTVVTPRTSRSPSTAAARHDDHHGPTVGEALGQLERDPRQGRQGQPARPTTPLTAGTGRHASTASKEVGKRDPGGRVRRTKQDDADPTTDQTKIATKGVAGEQSVTIDEVGRRQGRSRPRPISQRHQEAGQPVVPSARRPRPGHDRGGAPDDHRHDLRRRHQPRLAAMWDSIAQCESGGTGRSTPATATTAACSSTSTLALQRRSATSPPVPTSPRRGADHGRQPALRQGRHQPVGLCKRLIAPRHQRHDRGRAPGDDPASPARLLGR